MTSQPLKIDPVAPFVGSHPQDVPMMGFLALSVFLFEDNK